MILIILSNHTIDGLETGDLRLTAARFGRLEMFLSGRWQPVADSNMNWTRQNSEVVCRELGYAPNGKLSV